MEVPDDVFDAALTKIEAQFSNHEFFIPGELLHVFGLRLWSASEKFLDITRDEAFDQCKAYVDYLFEHGKLDKLEPETVLARHSSYGGLGYTESESKDFKGLASYLGEKRGQARRNQQPAWGEEILADMRKNADVFSKIALQRDASSAYHRIPVLASIEPAKFVQTWLGMEPGAQRNLAVALDGRYNYGGLDGELKAELPWLLKVKAEADKLIEGKARPTQVRFRLLFDMAVEKYLQKQESSVTAQG